MVVTLVAIGLTAMTAGNVDAAEVKTVRTAADEERTRVVFDLTGSVKYSVFTLKNPDRVVIDFEDTWINHVPALRNGDGGALRGLRYAPRGTLGLRVVLDVSRTMVAKDMRLPPSGPYGHRVVLDLSDAVPAMARNQERPRSAAGSITLQKPALAPASAVAITDDARRHTRTAVAAAGPTGSPLRPRVGPRARGRSTSTTRSGAGRPAIPDVDTPTPARNSEAWFNAPNFDEAFSAGDAFFKRLASDIELDVSGRVGAEGRVFFQDPRFTSQPGTNVSFSFQPEIYSTWDNDRQSLLVVPFARWDENDTRRTHVDLREFSYIYAASEWELRAGVRKVFWGVAESNHLVDIINQTDLIENVDFEDKLGQPMVNLALIQDWGSIDLFVLPGFRDRTFPGRDGRFQGPFRIVTAEAEYESAAENTRVDFAGRYSHYFGAFDVGLYHFWGTSREPRFGAKQTKSGETILFPIYDIIHQTGTDVQATVDNWLFKFEALRRQGQGDDTFVAAVGGFEYTYVGVFESTMDVGVLAEYHWDERGRAALYPFNDDLFFGSRLAFNDAADSQVLGGMLSDLNGDGHFLNIEASRRIGDFWKVELEMRLLLNIAPVNPMFAFNRDDHIQLELLRYF